jgi:hypothetical protein
MPVVVVMARILNAVMGMRGFKDAIRHGVKSRAPQGGNSSIAITGFAGMSIIDHASITTCRDYE